MMKQVLILWLILEVGSFDVLESTSVFLSIYLFLVNFEKR